MAARPRSSTPRRGSCGGAFRDFDGDPVFCRLLAGDDEKGFSDVLLDGAVETKSEYVRNTAIVSTEIRSANGAAIRITDFAPRFGNFGRIMRPPQLIRIIEPIAGLPRITIRFRPTHNYGEGVPHRSSGSNHIRYWGGETAIRLTTDAPLSYIENEAHFVLTRPVHLVFGADEPFPSELSSTCREFCDRTRDYWQQWVRRLSIGYDWQDAMIRAAITLKLSNFEETGAVVAALTTSIPEAPGSGRTWDYRYCWLRDAYFVVKALNRIGATGTMEDFINYTLGIVAEDITELHPVYGVVPNDTLEERFAPSLKGYQGHGPVRVGNQAGEQVQHDAYGSVILAATPMFFDRRLPREAGEAQFRLLETLGNKAAEAALQPDAGIWEYRGRSRVHTHSAAMCWAGCSRLGAIAARFGLADRAAHWNGIADLIKQAVLERGWNEKRGAFTAAFGGEELDASVLLLPELGLVDPDDTRFTSTVKLIRKELQRDQHVMRYTGEDDFGLPETAFLVCRFWLIDALYLQGEKTVAREMFEDSLRYRNHYGLLSEDVHPNTGALWGNFPQTYSMAGLITTGMRLSRSWEDRYWHAIFIISNRVAVPDPKRGIHAGGLEVALRATLRDHTCVWVGWSGEVRPREECETRTITRGKMTYIVTDLSDEDYQEYYSGFANQVLWPVLHYRLDLAEFTRRDLTGYLRVNERFAEELDKVLEPDDIIWVHDYHLIPLAKALRERGRNNKIGFFLHIPLPPPDILTALPNHERLIPALCHYDLVGFQTQGDSANFARYLASECGMPAHIPSVSGTSAGLGTMRIGTFPVGIETREFNEMAKKAESSNFLKRVLESVPGDIVIGVDRLDYSKGIALRLEGYDRFLNAYPDWRGPRDLYADHAQEPLGDPGICRDAACHRQCGGPYQLDLWRRRLDAGALYQQGL